MEIIIHGTKEAYNILYCTNDDIARKVGYDVRPKSNDTDNFLGKTSYELKCFENGYLFSKFIIVRDTPKKANRIGRILFSVFIDKNEKLKGQEIISLLDKLSDTYKKDYVVDNLMNKGEFELIREDFSFVDALKNEFQAKMTGNEQYATLRAGDKEPAFIYYNSLTELAEYFDKPFQEEYLDYKLIIFLDKNWLGNPSENPIADLPNSGVDLTHIIKLKNEYYYLKNFDRTINIKIYANGNIRSDSYGNNCIRTYDVIKIYYNKNEQFYYPINVEGTLFSDNIQKYLCVDGKNVKLRYEAFEKPQEIEKEFRVIINARKERNLGGVDLQFDLQKFQTLSSNEYTFKVQGEKLKRAIKITAKKDEFIGELTIDPLTSDSERVLVLNEVHTLRFFVRGDNGKELSGVKLSVNNKRYNGDDIIKFIGEDVEKEHTIRITHDEYDSKEIRYKPNVKEETINESIKKSPPQKRFKIDAGVHGVKSSSCPGYSTSQYGSYLLSEYIIPKKGYRFTKFELNDSRDTFVAQYEKVTPLYKRPIFIASFVLVLLILSMSTWLLFDYLSEKEPPLTEERIVKYLDGDSLLPNVLKDFKDEWYNLRPEIKNNQNVFSKFKSVFFGGENSNDLNSTDFKHWENINKMIIGKIALRTQIELMDFRNLKTNYLDQLVDYKGIIEGVDSLYYKQLKESIGDKVNSLPLKDAFSLIDETYNQLKNPQKVDGQINDNDRNPELPVVTETPTTKVSVSNTNANTKTSKKGHEASSQDEFEKAFWKLVNSGNTEMVKYKAFYNKYKAMKGEELDYLNKILKNSEAFEEFRKVREITRKNAKQISDLENK